jgi:ABC-type glycerol-3-phosphate transport system permease component
MASFALSRLKFRGRTAVLFLFISGLFVPAALLLLPLFLMLQDLHVLGSFNAIPQDLEEAAFLDGASYYQVFWKVALPLAKPGLIVATIFNIFGIWNEFVLGYVLISKTSLKTLPLGLSDILMKQYYTADYGKVFAAIAIAMAPIIILYIAFQRKIVGGSLTGAIKE